MVYRGLKIEKANLMEKVRAVKPVPKIQTSHAVLVMADQYILQLRDNKPEISAAGQWSLFGGMKDNGETPLKAIKREIKEELLIEPSFKYLWLTDYYDAFVKTYVRTFFFEADVENIWKNHKLMEGQAAGIFKFEQIKKLDVPSVIKNTLELFHKLKKRKS